MSQVQLSSLSPIAHKGVPCISTEMLAQAYEVESKQIRQNFTNNRERFVEGKHFFQLSGNDLKEFKNYVENFDLVQLDKRARHFTLWTERGAARHAKMLNSDKAWDVFELLEETFFRVAAERYAEQSKNIGQLTPAHRAELKGIVDAKLSTYPASVQGKARSEIWTRFNRHFRIAEYAQLPAERMAEARDYPFRLYREGDESLCLKRLLAKPVKAPIIKIGAEDATNILRPFFKESLFPVHQAPVSAALSTVTGSTACTSSTLCAVCTCARRVRFCACIARRVAKTFLLCSSSSALRALTASLSAASVAGVSMAATMSVVERISSASISAMARSN